MLGTFYWPQISSTNVARDGLSHLAQTTYFNAPLVLSENEFQEQTRYYTR